MEGQENIPYNTWGNLWKLIGIQNKNKRLKELKSLYLKKFFG